MSILTKIHSFGSYLPEKVLTNDDLSKMVDTSDEWIVRRTGISSRHIAKGHETTSYMGAKALEAAMKRGGILPSEIDCIIVATTTQDKPLPSTACEIGKILGVNNAQAFDLQAACTGFVYAMSIANLMIKSGEAKTIAIIGSERMSSVVNWTDRATCVLFGDGAGAMILRASSDCGIIDCKLSASSDLHDILITNIDRHIEMDGKSVFKYATEEMSRNLVAMLEKNNLKASDLSSVIAHQANYRILSHVAEKLGVSEEIFPMTMKIHGNTSAASIPLAFDYWFSCGKVKSGDIIAFQGVGAGMTIGTALVRF
ncbi:beta-ketoacyl-ACP synthase III [Candidatus Deianiraea vastatrix]|uniref:Beta-ketoacyl-[acyl-carrier-protein] synthase III n=1 Tax=Candidatus Deianiraea vastatrix TaxID=2163644 RepID=A0A5B8XF99_9RICK|nr:beta-ketoacyl-ACP synthase III [Candidatus Deianiraea vastatrix]QED23605.1 3-oxoacyl-[acyl-carrier-protein] synthase 3 [Candidatus Deianiraea vastatrix]